MPAFCQTYRAGAWPAGPDKRCFECVRVTRQRLSVFESLVSVSCDLGWYDENVQLLLGLFLIYIIYTGRADWAART